MVEIVRTSGTTNAFLTNSTNNDGLMPNFLIFGMHKTLARRDLLEIRTLEVAGPGFGGPNPLQPGFLAFQKLEILGTRARVAAEKK